MFKGSATLSMAYAGAVFADACLRGLKGGEYKILIINLQSITINYW